MEIKDITLFKKKVAEKLFEVLFSLTFRKQNSLAKVEYSIEYFAIECKLGSIEGAYSVYVADNTKTFSNIESLIEYCNIYENYIPYAEIKVTCFDKNGSKINETITVTL